ncbi:MAG: hypothetical protein QG597_1088 [Actinomycetota bacterium]|nr:hypothetical protein [Actinomycetota bacterium]
MPEPQDQVHWVDPSGQQVGPEPLEVLLQRHQAGQVPPTTLIWWEGAADWTPLHQAPGVSLPAAAVPAPSATGAQIAPGSASAALMSGMTDQELDDEFIDLVARSWEMYKETEYATSIDEATLGGVITAMVDCGFVLIDLATASPWAAAATTTTTADVGSTVTMAHHQLRFEEPSTHARVTMSLEHLTPDPAVAKLIGHRAAVIVGYGERVPNFSKVGQALRQEVQSTFIASPEPGTVTFDADLSSGYVYAQIDLLLELERYIDEHLDVDHELLRRHLASVIYTMKTFIQARFGA